MNFTNFNKSFENKYTVHKSLLREEKLQNSKKATSKKNLLESIDKPLNERDWKFTIPGSFRNAIFDAGEEEDYEGVRTALIDLCSYVVDHIDESNFDLDDQDYVEEAFEEFAEELDYIELEDEDEVNYYLNELYDLLDNTDIFLGLREGLNEEAEEEEEIDHEETFRQAIIDWFYDHEQAKSDIEEHVGVPVEDISFKGFLAWIAEHGGQLQADFEAFFNYDIDESLNESQNQYDEEIFDIWWRCVEAGSRQDAIINDTIEEFIEKIGKTYFDDDLDTTVSNLTNSEKRTLLRRMQEVATDLLGESLKEEKITSGDMPQEDINIIQPLIDDFDSLEDDNKDVLSITWNFGRRNSDSKMTAGVDIYFLVKGSEENLQPYIKQVEDIILSDGYKFDDSLGYGEDHWKEHLFGDGYHTQIVEMSANDDYEPELTTDDMNGGQWYESLKEDLAREFKKIHDEDEYLWNLHNTDYSFIYNKLAEYGDVEEEGIEEVFRKMPQEEQFSLFNKLIAPYDKKNESLKESVEPVKPTEEEFQAYCVIQHSGITNMFDINTVMEAAEYELGIPLTKENIFYIFEHYQELMDEYGFNEDMWDNEIYAVRDAYGMNTDEDDYYESLTEANKYESEFEKAKGLIKKTLSDLRVDDSTISDVVKVINNYEKQIMDNRGAKTTADKNASYWGHHKDIMDTSRRNILRDSDLSSIGPTNKIKRNSSSENRIENNTINLPKKKNESLDEQNCKWAVVDDYSGDIIDVFDTKEYAKSSAAETQELHDDGMYIIYRGPFVVEPYYGDEFDESLNEEFAFRSNDELYDLDKEINDYLNQNDFHGMIDLAYISPNDVPVPSITYEIHMGDWKHEHLFFKHLIREFMDEKNIPYMMTEEDEDNGSDTYTAYHTIHLMKHKEDESLTEGSGSLTAFMKKSKDFHNVMNNFISTYSTEAGIPTYEVLDMIREYLRSGNFDYSGEDKADKVDERLSEDTVKQDGKWVNKGKEGTHGKFKTKKEADAQRKAMFANGYKEELEEEKEFGDKSIKAQLALPENQAKLNSILQAGTNWRESKQKFIELIKSLDCTDANKKQAIFKINKVNNEGGFYSTVGTYLVGDKVIK